MSDTTTTNYGFVKPEVGASADTWGGKLNGDLDAIDAAIKAAWDVAEAALPKAGGTMTGALTNASGFVGPLNGNASSASTAAACTGNSATASRAAKASTLANGGGDGAAMTFTWSGQAGTPTWVWGGGDGANMFVYNPSNFSVSYAASAGSASTAGALGNGAAVNPGGGSALLYWGSGNYWVRKDSQGLELWSDSGQVYFHNNINANDVFVRSDRRLKTDIWDAPSFGPILDEIRVRTFLKKGAPKVGVIAQELEDVLPDAVLTAPGETDGMKELKSVATDDILFMLLKEVQELRARVAELEIVP